jgi:hypothetical protein
MCPICGDDLILLARGEMCISCDYEKHEEQLKLEEK